MLLIILIILLAVHHDYLIKNEKVIFIVAWLIIALNVTTELLKIAVDLIK